MIPLKSKENEQGKQEENSMKKRVLQVLTGVLLMMSLCIFVGMPKQVKAEVKIAEYDEDSNKVTEVNKIPFPLVKDMDDLLRIAQKPYGILISEEEKEVTVPVSVKNTGKAVFSVQTENKGQKGKVIYSFSKDEEGKEVLGTVEAKLSESTSGDLYMDVTKGTYYLTLEIKGTLKNDALFLVQGGVLSTKDRLLTNSNFVISGTTGKPIYYKVNMKNQGELDFLFQGTEFLASQVVLCDENKKPISKVETVGKDSIICYKTYVVPKGVYYYRVNTKNNCFMIQTAKSGYTDRDSSSSIQPRVLKNNRMITSYVSLADKKGSKKYYQYEAKKSSELKGLYIEFDEGSSGAIEVSIKLPGKGWTTKKLKEGEVYKISDKNIRKKGTYKIRIKKLSDKTTGTCTIGTDEYDDLSWLF